jgi:hypothetical protein
MRATGRWNGDTPLVEEYLPGDVIGQRMRFPLRAFRRLDALAVLTSREQPNREPIRHKRALGSALAA